MASGLLRGASAVFAVGAGGYFAGRALAHQTASREGASPSLDPPQPRRDDLAPTSTTPPTPPSPANERLARWHAKWESDSLGWHLSKPHPALAKHLNDLLGDNGETQRMVLFPLCGASVDLGYLARRGHHVVGVEAVPKAIDRLLSEFGEEVKGGTPPADRLWLRVGQPSWIQKLAAEQMSKADERTYVVAPFLFAVQGDFLRFDRAASDHWGFPQFDAAFDRGGLVAVPPDDRPRYAEVLTQQMAPQGKLLLVCVEHEPDFGPPHSVDTATVRKLFEPAFEIDELSREDRMGVEPHWKERGATRFEEVVYMLTRRVQGHHHDDDRAPVSTKDVSQPTEN